MQLITTDHAKLKAKLQEYLENDPRYRTVYEYTKSRFNEAKNLSAHNWAHIYRDTLNAIAIGEAEGADMSIVMPTITMHDIGFCMVLQVRHTGGLAQTSLQNTYNKAA